MLFTIFGAFAVQFPCVSWIIFFLPPFLPVLVHFYFFHKNIEIERNINFIILKVFYYFSLKRRLERPQCFRIFNCRQIKMMVSTPKDLNLKENFNRFKALSCLLNSIHVSLYFLNCCHKSGSIHKRLLYMLKVHCHYKDI